MKDRKRLTAKKIEKLNKPGRFHDGEGLYLAISTTGARSWLLRYQRAGHERMAGLGPLALVTLKQARERAHSAKLMLLDGIDPIDARRARNQQRLESVAATTKTFRYAAEQFLIAHEDSWRSTAHRHQWRSSLKTYVYPALGELPVQAISTEHVRQLLAPMWASKRTTASRVRGRIEAVLDWAKACGLRDGENPARWKGHLEFLLGKDKAIKQHFAAMAYAEVPGFLAKLRQQEGVAARALEVLILCATRSAETLAARWSEIDLDAKLWTIPAHRMKAGKEHRVPLSDRVVELFRELPRERGNDFCFVGSIPRHGLGKSALGKILVALRPGCTVHGFRSSFRDWAAECTNTQNHIIEQALAHKVSSAVEAAYLRSDLIDKRRLLMAAWSAYCAGGAASVVPLFGGAANA